MRPADRAWLALATAVVVYDVLAHEDEMLSDGAERYLRRQPWATRVMVALTGAHLLRMLPCFLDPFWFIGAARRKLNPAKAPLTRQKM